MPKQKRYAREGEFSIILGMLVSLSAKGNDASLPKGPLYLPKGKTALVGNDLFEALKTPTDAPSPLFIIGGKCLYAKIGEDTLKELDEFLSSPADYYCIELDRYSNEAASLIAKEYVGETIYLLCPSLSPNACRPISISENAFLTEEQSWDAFVCDLVGLPRKNIEPQRKPRVEKKPFVEPPLPIEEPKEEKASPVIVEAPVAEPDIAASPVISPTTALFHNEHAGKDVLRRFKRDGLNPLFSIVFLALSFATFLGYFYLGEESTDIFRIACIIMSALFPFMSCIPMGFLFHDLKIKKLSDSNFMVLALSLILGLSILMPCLGLSIGNSLGWKESDLLLFTLLGLSSPLWILIRVFLARFLPKKAKEGKRS